VRFKPRRLVKAVWWPERSGGFYKIHYGQDQGSEHDPEQLVPVEERNTRELWICRVVPGRITEGDKGNDEKKQNGMELLL
jgi:hypothetical protein